MELGTSICSRCIQTPAMFLNVGPMWCMFGANDYRAAYEVEKWVNSASDKVGELNSLLGVESSKPLRLSAYVNTLEHYCSMAGALEIPHGGPLLSVERRLRSEEWRGFQDGIRQVYKEWSGKTDLVVASEYIHGDPAHDYPWTAGLRYHSESGSSPTYAEAWFVAEWELFLMRRYFANIEAEIRTAMSRCQQCADTNEGSILLSELRTLALF